jgi:mannan endo-1,4-beta-mannosidase
MTIKTLKLALGLAAVSALTMQSAIADWSISGKDILDPNGNPFIYRGISLGDFPSPLPTLQLQQDLAQTGANALKVLVSNVTTAANLQSYIDLCVANKMVCVFSHSDAYGWGDDPLADHYANAFNYWIRSGGFK